MVGALKKTTAEKGGEYQQQNQIGKASDQPRIAQRCKSGQQKQRNTDEDLSGPRAGRLPKTRQRHSQKTDDKSRFVELYLHKGVKISGVVIDPSPIVKSPVRDADKLTQQTEGKEQAKRLLAEQLKRAIFFHDNNPHARKGRIRIVGKGRWSSAENNVQRHVNLRARQRRALVPQLNGQRHAHQYRKDKEAHAPNAQRNAELDPTRHILYQLT